MPQSKDKLADWIKKNKTKQKTKKEATICCLKEIHLRAKDTHRLKVRGWKKIFHRNGNNKKVGGLIKHLTQDFLDKMAEEKDLDLTSSHEHTKKLTTEQPSVKKTGTKKIFCIQRQRRSHDEMAGGALS